MNHRIAVAALALVAVTGIGGCRGAVETAAGQDSSPSRLTPVPGTDLKTVTLTPQAVTRVGLRTATVQRDARAPGRTTVPYAAIVYADDGTTWTYTVVGPRSYLRRAVTVAAISGNTAVLSTGPAPGSSVVTTGTAELLGAEYQISGEE